jgi:2-polyprenyl-3-methyl-5-hydroxy-6-metoxy-1,4-benzoquinol methylase
LSAQLKPRTSHVNARLWGARAGDWADIQEGTLGAVFEVVLEHACVTSGTRYLDVGCGAGMAAQMAAAPRCRASTPPKRCSRSRDGGRRIPP